jgi:hypothetical protein
MRGGGWTAPGKFSTAVARCRTAGGYGPRNQQEQARGGKVKYQEAARSSRTLLRFPDPTFGIAPLGKAAADYIKRIVSFPRQAMDQGITTSEAIPWAADTARATSVRAGASVPRASRNCRTCRLSDGAQMQTYSVAPTSHPRFTARASPKAAGHTKEQIARDIAAGKLRDAGPLDLDALRSQIGNMETTGGLRRMTPDERAALQPLLTKERILNNYSRSMTPDEVMHSEPVWRGAARLAAEKGISESEAFAELANAMWQRQGANRYISWGRAL